MAKFDSPFLIAHKLCAIFGLVWVCEDFPLNDDRVQVSGWQP